MINPAEDSGSNATAYVQGVLGACGGAVAGYFAFDFMYGQGFYAIAMPGALIGLACGYASRIRSLGLAIFCCVFGLLFGLFVEAKQRPFIADDSLSYFFTHLQDLAGTSIVLIVVGALMAGWFGRGR